MAWYIVWVGRQPGIYRRWVDANRQVHRYPGNSHKKFNTEAEALFAFYGPNQGLEIEENPPALEIEGPQAPEIEGPSTRDMKIRTLPTLWSQTHAIILCQAMLIAFVIWKLM